MLCVEDFFFDTTNIRMQFSAAKVDKFCAKTMIDLPKVTFKSSEKRKAQLQAEFGSLVAGASESGQAFITRFNSS